MLTIRFFRTGKKHQPSFKVIVVQKTQSARSGKFLEELGFYSPLLKKTELKKDRIEYWISKGAKLSDTVYNLLIKNKILIGKKRPSHKPPKKIKETVGAKQAPASAVNAAPAQPI